MFSVSVKTGLSKSDLYFKEHKLYHHHHHHHYHNEHNQGLCLKVQGVLGLSIFVLVFPYPAVHEVGTGKPASVGGYYPFVPGGLTIYFDKILCLLLCCPRLI
jgi:hypothetical protein